MRQISLRVLLPLFGVLMMLVVGASLAFTLHQRQHMLTQDSRAALLADVARLAQLAELGGDAAPSFLASGVTQLANRSPVRAVILLADRGNVLMANDRAWHGQGVQEVWPQLDLPRVTRVALTQQPDWQLSQDENHMDAIQSFALPVSGGEGPGSRRGLAYIAYDLRDARQQVQYDEMMERVPDLVGLMGLMGLMAWLMGRYVTRPLGHLGQVATALRSGQWDVPIPQNGLDEINRLGAGFEALRQELEATWRAMPDLMFELDGEGRYLRVEARRSELLVLDVAHLIGRTVREVMPESAAQTVLQALADASQYGGVWGRELVLDVPAGRRWFEISVARKASPQQSHATFVVISRDITERKQAEEGLLQLNDDLERRVAHRTAELLAAKNEAERANQSKSEFLSRMSHELRTPLNAVLGFGQLLELSVRDPLLVGHVRQILHGGKHLLDLINEVLDLARVESGQMTVSLEPVSVDELILECRDLVRPQAEAQGVLLRVVRCDPHWQVMADRIRLKQVLLNLLSNAIKYNHPGGEVNVCGVSEAVALTVRISDTGAGLTQVQQERLFVPFERLDADLRHIEGTGIGLALSKRLVDLMGGGIGVDSQQGIGSTFWVKLPLAQGLPSPSVAPCVQAGSAAPRGTHADVLPCERTVLCIEDNPNNLRLIEGVLGMLPGVRMISAMAPGLGLDLARTHLPDLILLDINLPDMDGYAVMQCLREHPSTQPIPVVAVSANAMHQDLARGRAAGFVDYVTKPIDVGHLMRLVDELTRKRLRSGG
ncbi:MAG: response regulator [Burkholderiales bacterium]|nr:response regulator [Burkholderiales bacterium]